MLKLAVAAGGRHVGPDRVRDQQIASGRKQTETPASKREANGEANGDAKQTETPISEKANGDTHIEASTSASKRRHPYHKANGDTHIERESAILPLYCSAGPPQMLDQWDFSQQLINL